jgi:hypothetical protein
MQSSRPQMTVGSILKMPVPAVASAPTPTWAHTFFPSFPLLPPELRLEIWRLCLPHRVLKLNYLRRSRKIRRAEESATISRNASLPTIAAVNHEARALVLEMWCRLELPPFLLQKRKLTRVVPDPTPVDTMAYAEQPWFDRSRTQYVYATKDVDDLLESATAGTVSGWTDRLERPCVTSITVVDWAALQTDCAEAALDLKSLVDAARYLYASTVNFDHIEHPDVRKRREMERYISLFGHRKKWTVIVVEAAGPYPQAVHSGFFGLLADENMRIVPVAEMNTEVSLYETLGLVMAERGLLAEAVKLGYERLEEVVKFLLGAGAKDRPLPRFEAAVMVTLDKSRSDGHAKMRDTKKDVLASTALTIMVPPREPKVWE